MAESNFQKTVRNYIWEDLSLAFNYSKKIRIYVDNHLRYNRWSMRAIAIIAGFSAISYWFSPKLGAITAAVTALLTIMKIIVPSFTQPMIELQKLNESADFYASYLTKLEQLYIELIYNIKHPSFIEPEFFELKDHASKYLRITNDYYRGIWWFQENKIKKQFDTYVTRIFNQASDS